MTVLCATQAHEIPPRILSERSSERVFLGVSALLFVVSAALTTLWCESMPPMGGMPMPGGWTMSMTWMRMPGQTWPMAAASFVAMWLVMMMAMMLPSLLPLLRRHRECLARQGETHIDRLTALIGLAYFSVWTVLAIVVFPLGATLETLEMRLPALARTEPALVGAIVLICGVVQITPWKAHHLACWREAMRPRHALPSNSGTAWREGLLLGLHCTYCCANLTGVLLVIGIMDLRAMAVVTAAMTCERLAPSGESVARAIGAVVIGAGLLLIARTAGLG